MENITFITDSLGQEHVIINQGNDEFISMPRTTWDEIKAAEENNG